MTNPPFICIQQIEGGLEALSTSDGQVSIVCRPARAAKVKVHASHQPVGELVGVEDVSDNLQGFFLLVWGRLCGRLLEVVKVGRRVVLAWHCEVGEERRETEKGWKLSETQREELGTGILAQPPTENAII